MVNDLSTGGNLVCVTDGSQVIVWNVETWGPPVYLEADESGLYLRDKPLPSQDTPVVRLMRRLRGPASRMRRWRLGHRLLRWLNRQLARARKPASELTAQISSDGGWLAVAVRNVMHIASTRTWESIAKLTLDGATNGLLVVPGRHWLVVRFGARVQYWSTETWLPEEGFIDNSRIAESANHGAWSPDGALLAIVSEDRTLRVHDSDTGTCLTELRLDGELSEVAWLSADRLAAVGAHGVYWFNYISGSEPVWAYAARAEEKREQP